MIPPNFAESSSSNAERKVFGLLQKDSRTENWIVLHSLNLSVTTARRYGEIDFLVLIPEVGIVCLEVKGGGIKCEDGTWWSTGSNGIPNMLKRSPFAQARANMFSLRERLANHFGKAHPACALPTGFIAVYPDCKSPPESPEFTRSEVIDCDDLSKPISVSIMRHAKEKLGFPDAAASFKRGPLLKELRTFLRPDFDRAIARSATIGQAEERIVEFTSEQLDKLAEMEDNSRCLFEGAAGTGKTLLAMHLAKERAVAGKRVLFICFNKLLGTWLNGEVGSTPRLKTGSFFSTLRKLILMSEFEKQYLEREQTVGSAGLPALMCEYGRLAILEFDEKFDVLIVDEIQDLAIEPVLSVFDDWLKNGLAHGEWVFFGDFNRQALFNAANNGTDSIQKFCSSFARSKLFRNCRNTRQIADCTSSLSGFESPPYRYRLGIADGAPVQFHYWKNHPEQAKDLADCLHRYREDHISLHDIVIVSSFKLENSGLREFPLLDGIKIVDITEDRRSLPSNAVAFSTIHAFKGMESSIVLFIDLEMVGQEAQKALLYVGMSRARSALHVFVNKSQQTMINDLCQKTKLVQD
jgi:hypothetical protein